MKETVLKDVDAMRKAHEREKFIKKYGVAPRYWRETKEQGYGAATGSE